MRIEKNQVCFICGLVMSGNNIKRHEFVLRYQQRAFYCIKLSSTIIRIIFLEL